MSPRTLCEAASLRTLRVTRSWCVLLCITHLLVDCSAKTPVVKWGQKPDRLFIKIMAPDVLDPDVVMEENRLIFKGYSRGESFSTDLKLLRKINVTESKYEIDSWSVTFTLKKVHEEPCWKRLTKSTKTITWLKKDYDTWDSDGCQRAKEEWRAAYFTATMSGEDPNQKEDKSPNEAEDGSEEHPSKVGLDPEKKKEVAQWEKTIKDYRKKAVSIDESKPAANSKTKKKPKKSEL